MAPTQDDGSAKGVLLALPDPEEERPLRDALQRLGFKIAGRALDGPDLIEQSARRSASVAVVSTRLHRVTPSTVATAKDAGIATVLLVRADEIDRYQGLGELVPDGSSTDDVVNAVQRAIAGRPVRETAPQPETLFEEEASRRDKQADGGRLLALTSGKGAPGVTTIALALASALGQKGLRVVVLDADLRGGNVGPYLDLDPRRGLVGFTLATSDELTATQVLDELQDGPGFAVLAGLERGDWYDRVPAERLLSAASTLRNEFDFVVADLGEVHTGPSWAVGQALARSANRVALVTRPDLVALWNARAALQRLSRALGSRADPIAAVVNHREGHEHYTAEEVERVLGVPLLAEVREDRKAARAAIRDQVPVSMVSRAMAREIASLTARLLDPPGVPTASEPQRRRWPAWALRRA